jgi:hypothetical protein
MRTSTTTAAIAAGTALVALLFAGCANEPKRAERDFDKTTPTVTETERPGSAAPSDITPVTAAARISDLKVGTALDAQGKVAENQDNLNAGDAIHASIAVGDVGAGSKVKAVWLGPEGVRLADETKNVAAGVAFLAFHAPSTHGWAAGDYKVEIYLGDELASSESFDIVAPRPGA